MTDLDVRSDQQSANALQRRGSAAIGSICKCRGGPSFELKGRACVKTYAGWIASWASLVGNYHFLVNTGVPVERKAAATRVELPT